jgi:hypothetical protein
MQINPLSPAWLVALAAFGVLHLLIRVRPADVAISRWEQPRTHAVLWMALGLAEVAFGLIPMLMHALSAT